MVRNLFIITVSLVFLLNSLALPGYASSMMPEFLCEIGMKFYKQGKYDDALHEFRKALLVQPAYQPALEYIRLIQGKQELKEEKAISGPVTPTIIPGAIKEKEKPWAIFEKASREKKATIYPAAPVVTGFTETGVPTEKLVLPLPAILRLDSSLAQVLQPIEIEQGKSILIEGNGIQRFLVTQPDILTVEKKGANELWVKGNNIGYTYLYVWDSNGRWTTEFLGVSAIPEGPTYEELLRRKEEIARNFKLRYTLDWSSYETGRRLDRDSLKRSSYSYTHGLSLTGQTPYGNFDSGASIRRLKTTTDLTYFSFGLTDGSIGPFKGFSLHGFDYTPYFSNLVLPGVNLRGGILNSPVFDKKLDYTVFWGRESGGRYGNLSPGLYKSKHSFLDGFNLNYSPVKQQNYKFSLAHGWGRDRLDSLNAYGYDLLSTWNFAGGGLTYEIANDSEAFAHLVNFRYIKPKINLSTELRDIDKNFNSMTGMGWRDGELGGLFNLNYRPTKNLNMLSRLDLYRDRLYPAEDNYHRLNEDFNWNTTYTIDPSSSLNLNYALQNQLGRISQNRYQNAGLGINKTIKFINKDISTYAGYARQENKSYTSHSLDYINNRFSSGIRFSLLGELYYYLSKELNWLEETYTATHIRPVALEQGLDWTDQIGRIPLYGTFRMTYRDEEDATSAVGLLSGEDYLEGYLELSYRPGNGSEIFGSSRVRNSWADSPGIAKRMEASFYGGMRYLWDTGIKWESVGNIEGLVFKDFNSDGLRQRDEPPVAGVKLWLGKDKSQVTDIFGYYKFKNIKARKAYINIDASTIPAGFVLTVPFTQETSILHHQNAQINFGIISRSEIAGLVFEDVDGDGQYSKDDIAVKDAVIILEDGQKAATDSSGKYTFSHAAVGDHTLNLDLKSLPIYYLPGTPITKKITLFEGVTYVYNIPLKRIKE